MEHLLIESYWAKKLHVFNITRTTRNVDTLPCVDLIELRALCSLNCFQLDFFVNFYYLFRDLEPEKDPSP